MKTQNTNVTKIASIHRLGRIASLAALLVLLCFTSGAWAQPTPVLVTNGTGSPVNTIVTNTAVTPVFTSGVHGPVEYHLGPGQNASIGTVGPNQRLVIEHINIQTWASTQWFVELAGTGPGGVYTNTAFLLSPITFTGGRSFGVVSSTGKMFALGGTTLQFNFSNSTTNNTTIVPANTWVEVWGYLESSLSKVDDF